MPSRMRCRPWGAVRKGSKLRCAISTYLALNPDKCDLPLEHVSYGTATDWRRGNCYVKQMSPLSEHARASKLAMLCVVCGSNYFTPCWFSLCAMALCYVYNFCTIYPLCMYPYVLWPVRYCMDCPLPPFYYFI